MNFALGLKLLDEEERRRATKDAPAPGEPPMAQRPRNGARFAPLSAAPEHLVRAATAALAEPHGGLAKLGMVAGGAALFGGAVLGGLYIARKIEGHKKGGDADKPALRWDAETIVPVVVAAIVGAAIVWLITVVRTQAVRLAALQAHQPGQIPASASGAAAGLGAAAPEVDEAAFAEALHEMQASS